MTWLYLPPEVSTPSPSAQGGGGLDLAFELAIPSARTVCMVEREGFAVAQLVSAMEAGHLPPAPIWSDVQTFDGKPWRGLVDGVIGGIPCQPHSLAGRKRGQLDGRDLWSDARRIVATGRPWFVLIENVSGMLSAGDDEVAGAERVWRDLRKLGYAVEGGLFTAAEVGASHERARVFILAVADSECWTGQLRGEPRDLHREGQSVEGGRSRAERKTAHAARDGSSSLSGVGLADPHSQRLEGIGADAGTFGRQDARGQAGLRDGAALVDATSERRREGQPEPELRSGRGAASSTDGDVGDTSIARGGAISIQSRRQNETGGHADRASLFPPAPSDIDGWRETLARSPELEPAFRRMADGLAGRLDTARVDRLRLLGNGVVPLEGAYAIRTLATRLAKRGSSGADELVRLMV